MPSLEPFDFGSSTYREVELAQITLPDFAWKSEILWHIVKNPLNNSKSTKKAWENY